MKLSKAIAPLFLSVGLLSGAHAGLVGVKTITVKNQLNDWLQVGEVIALDVSGIDRALASQGATATATNNYGAGSEAGKAIDGITTGLYSAHELYHSGSQLANNTLTIALSAAFELSSFEIYGVAAGCCRSRDRFTIDFLDIASTSLFSTLVDARSGDRRKIVDLPNTSVTSAIPEPGSLALVGIGLLGAGVLRRRRGH